MNLNTTESQAAKRGPRLLFMVLMLLLIALLFYFMPKIKGIKPNPLTGEAGDLLYISSFEAYEDEWELYPGMLKAEIVDGQMQLSGQGGIPFSSTRPYFEDFDLRVDASAFENPNNDGYGVILSMQDPNNMLVFEISSDGYYRVSQLNQGFSKIISTWIPSEAIRQGLGVSNQIRVVRKDDQYYFFVNDQALQLCLPDKPEGTSTFTATGECLGKLVDSLEHDLFDTGHLGLMADASSANVVIGFDNFIVTYPKELIVEIDGNDT